MVDAVIFAPHTLVVSRRIDATRRARFHANADAVGLKSWCFFDAIDGPSMWLETGKPSAVSRHKRLAPEPLSPGEVGCLLSHAAIWQSAAALRIDWMAVLEDDVEINCGWPAWLSFFDALPRDWLMAHAAGDHEIEPERVNAFVSRVKWSYGTRFMLLSSEAIRMLAAMPVTMTEPADWMLRPLFDTGRVYTPSHPLMRHRNDPGGMP